jgi:hypothetical protein
MRRLVVSALVAVVSVAFWAAAAGARDSTSNGEAAKSATRILADAKAATNGTSTVTISGTIITGGHRLSLDIVSGHGAGGGTIGKDDVTFHIVVTPPNIYLMSKAATWTKITGSRAAGQLFAGKWIQTTTANEDFADFSRLVDISALTGTMTASGAVSKGAITTFRGKPAVPLEDNGSKDPGTMFVAAVGRPYILGIVSADGKSHLLFSQYGSAKPPTTPKHSISLAELHQQPNTDS